MTNGGWERAYEALRQSEELHRATLSNISDAVFLVDDHGAFAWVCPNVDVIFGHVPDEVHAMGQIGALLGEGLFDPADLDARGEIRNLERSVTSKSGERRTVLVHLKRVAIQGGTVLVTCRDVSELRAAERKLSDLRLELAHAARLALVGELTASIVHEIQQPLTAILANAGAGRRQLATLGASAGAAAVSEVLADIDLECRRVLEIIDRLRSLVRKRALELQPLFLNDVVDDVLRLVAPDAQRRCVRVDCELAASLPQVDGDRVSLQQVVLNLVVNAMEALEEAGAERRRVVLRTHGDSGTVELTVSDNGRGLAAESFDRLFDPFYTTKHEGIGLGLAIAQSIAEAHAGRIWAEPPRAGGATFHLALPVRPGG
jgi:PAS domain S-box-containing protein